MLLATCVLTLQINIAYFAQGFCTASLLKGGCGGSPPATSIKLTPFRGSRSETHTGLLRAQRCWRAEHTPLASAASRIFFSMRGSFVTMLESTSYHTGKHKLAPPLAVASGGKRTKSCMFGFTGGARQRPPSEPICVNFGVRGAGPK